MISSPSLHTPHASAQQDDGLCTAYAVSPKVKSCMTGPAYYWLYMGLKDCILFHFIFCPRSVSSAFSPFNADTPSMKMSERRRIIFKLT